MAEPTVGQLFYSEFRNESNEFQNASLFFVDTPPKEGQQWMVTWIAQMEDYGNGLEVYIQPTSGGLPAQSVREATDEDINKFIDCILHEQGDPQQKLTEWTEIVDISPDCETLLPQEKQRLIKLISSQVESEQTL